MGKLSIEQKATRDEEALERAKKVLLDCTPEERKVVEYIFPELKESEDKKFLRYLIDCCKSIIESDDKGLELSMDTTKRLFAWLKKQGDTKETLCDKCRKEQPSHSCQDITELGRCVLEKQGEQKPADKVEPKFHEGEWVVYDHRVYQVVELPKEGYINLGLRGNGKIEFAPSTYCRHWTIQDAKDGDVLADDYGIYILEKFDKCDKNCYVCIGAYQYSQKVYECEHMLCSTDAHPATKEQRDLLFQKMHEAGYEWDDEKKELKKIEQKPVWSEEDENILATIIEEGDLKPSERQWLKSFKDRVQPQPKQEWSEEDEMHRHWILEMLKDGETKTPEFADHFKAAFDWLKSLRTQNRWKPSDEQMKALDFAVDCIVPDEFCFMRKALIELYQNLKKLREE